MVTEHSKPVHHPSRTNPRRWGGGSEGHHTRLTIEIYMYSSRGNETGNTFLISKVCQFLFCFVLMQNEWHWERKEKKNSKDLENTLI